MSITLRARHGFSCVRRPMLHVAAALLLLGGAACDDPLRHLDEAKRALSALGDGGDGVDDADGKERSQGISLGAGHAKRMYYQFIDEAGRVRFVDRIADVPTQWRERVGFVEMDSPPPLSPMMAKNTRDQRFQEIADKYRKVMPQKSMGVVLYSADWCGWCKKAKRHLDRTGVDYEIRDIDRPRYLEELVAKTGQKGIPVLDVGGRVVTGFSPDRYDELIRGARS
jgi:glutaredoxin 3